MDQQKLLTELNFKAVRSSGAGGQHVNKVSSKVILLWDLQSSEGCAFEEKERLKIKLQNRLSKGTLLQLECDSSRSQWKNKQQVIERFLKLVSEALKVERPRKKTKVPKNVLKKHRKNKEKHSQKKELRKRII